MYISCLPYIKVEKESLDLHQRSVKSLLLKIKKELHFLATWKHPDFKWIWAKIYN